jgi:hypothetical protein
MRTVGLGAFFKVFTLVDLVIGWMILLFLPSMGMSTPVLQLTPLPIGLDKVLSLPVRTLLLRVVVDVGFTTEILPVVGINTELPVVGGVGLGTPDGFEVKHKKVSILAKFVQ